MSLQWQLPRELPPDMARIGQALFAKTNIFRQIGERFDQLFPPEEVFAGLYEAGGRGAISPLLLGLVTVFQMLEKVPDRVAAEYVVARLDWKYALHLPLDYAGFHFTALYAFRTRLLEHARERLVFDQLLARVQDLGLLQPKGKLRTDSTHVLGVVERLSQLELVAESLRVALQAVLQLAPAWAQSTLPAVFLERYQVRSSEYGLSQAQVQARLVQTGQDGFWFLAQVDRSAPEAVRQLAEVVLLRTVLEQQFPQGPSGTPAQRRPTGAGVIESPHEPEVRFGQKRGQGWIGYKAQVSETCDEAAPHLIVDLEPGSALANDSPALPSIQARLVRLGLRPAEQYVDQGYMSGENLLTSARAGITLMGVPLADTTSPPGFRQVDFVIDEQQQSATCPAGKRNRVWSERAVSGAPQPLVEVRFEATTCQACSWFGLCTTSRQGRSLTLSPYRKVLGERRTEVLTDAYRKKLHRRAGIEATISELVRGYHFRHARYRGLSKLRLQGYFTAVALNLKRLARWWTKPETTPA